MPLSTVVRLEKVFGKEVFTLCNYSINESFTVEQVSFAPRNVVTSIIIIIAELNGEQKFLLATQIHQIGPELSSRCCDKKNCQIKLNFGLTETRQVLAASCSVQLSQGKLQWLSGGNSMLICPLSGKMQHSWLDVNHAKPPLDGPKQDSQAAIQWQGSLPHCLKARYP